MSDDDDKTFRIFLAFRIPFFFYNIYITASPGLVVLMKIPLYKALWHVNIW